MPAHANDNWTGQPDPSKKLLTIAEVTVLVGVSRSMIYKSIKDPDLAFPRPVKIGVLARWDQDAVFDWMAGLGAKG